LPSNCEFEPKIWIKKGATIDVGTVVVEVRIEVVYVVVTVVELVG